MSEKTLDPSLQGNNDVLEIIPSEGCYVSLFQWGKKENRRKYEQDKREKESG